MIKEENVLLIKNYHKKRKKLILIFNLIVMGLTAMPCKTSAYTLNIRDKQISLKMKDEAVIPVLREFGRAFGIAIIVPEDFDKSVSVYVDNLSIEKTLEKIMGRSNLFMVWDKETLIKVGVLKDGRASIHSYMLTIGENQGKQPIKQQESEKKSIKTIRMAEILHNLSVLSDNSLPPLNMPGAVEYIWTQIQMTRNLEDRIMETKENETAVIQTNIEKKIVLINETSATREKSRLLEEYIDLMEMKTMLKIEKKQQLAIIQKSRIFLRNSLLTSMKFKKGEKP